MPPECWRIQVVHYSAQQRDAFLTKGSRIELELSPAYQFYKYDELGSVLEAAVQLTLARFPTPSHEFPEHEHYGLQSEVSVLILPPHPPTISQAFLCLRQQIPSLWYRGPLPSLDSRHSIPAGDSSWRRGLDRPSPMPKGLKAIWPRWCLIRAELSLKPLPHSEHLYGFSPVCVRLCLTRSELRGNSFPQKPHT